MQLGVVKVVAGYIATSAAALMASVKLACALGGPLMISFSGSFFR